MYDNNKEAKFDGLLSVQFIKRIFCVFTEFTYLMVFNSKKTGYRHRTRTSVIKNIRSKHVKYFPWKMLSSSYTLAFGRVYICVAMYWSLSNRVYKIKTCTWLASLQLFVVYSPPPHFYFLRRRVVGSWSTAWRVMC